MDTQEDGAKKLRWHTTNGGEFNGASGKEGKRLGKVSNLVQKNHAIRNDAGEIGIEEENKRNKKKKWDSSIRERRVVKTIPQVMP